jgi:DNA primase/predicted transcriptional regulator
MDVVDFIMYMEKTDKHEAITKAVRMIEGDSTNQSERLTRTAVLTKMFSYFKNGLHNCEPGQQYLAQRCIDFKKVEVGYNAGQFHHGNRKEAALIKSCLEVGLLIDKNLTSRTGDRAYVVFGKWCVVFALRDQDNHVSGLYFRSTLNDKDQRHFYLKDRAGLYPKYPEVATKKLILTESIIDAATLLQIPAITDQYSVLSLYGTNGLTTEHQAAIKNLSQLEEIIFWLNADKPGEEATKKYADQFKEQYPNVTIRTVTMPGGEDINSMAQSHADINIFPDLLNSRTDILFSIENKTGKLFIVESTEIPSGGGKKDTTKKVTPAQVQQTAASLDTTNPYKIRYSADMAHYNVQGVLPKTTDNMRIMLVIEDKASTQKARNRIDLYEDKQVEKLVKDVAEKLSLPVEVLSADLYKLTDLLEQHIDKQLQQPQEEVTPQRVLTAQERKTLEQFASQPKLMKRLNELLGQAGIVGEERNRIFLLLIALSHKTVEPLHALIQGSSGSGKTRLLKQISECMPQESVTKLTRLSDKVLYNFPENYFVNRLLCLEDMDGLSEEAEFALRELQSNGELNSATSIKLDNGQITSGQKTVRGPVASISCTTRGEIYEDNMGRVFLIAVDESYEQTQRIVAYQNSVAAGKIAREDEEKAKWLLREFMRFLTPYKVLNPYAQRILLPPQVQKVRRLNDLFQCFIRMVTMVNQYQRKKDNKGRLITELSDVEATVAVMFESIVLKVDELDGSMRQFYERLKEYLKKLHGEKHLNAEFSLREIRQELRLSKTQVFRYIGDLLRLEYITLRGGYHNKGLRYQIVYWDQYQALRDKIKAYLEEQIEKIRQEEAQKNKDGNGTPDK